MKFNSLTLLLKALIGVIDTGKYSGISVEDAKDHLEADDLFQWLEETVAGLDLGMIASTPDRRSEVNATLTTRVSNQTILLGSKTASAKYFAEKYGVENQGMCFLAALIADVIEENFTPKS